MTRFQKITLIFMARITFVEPRTMLAKHLRIKNRISIYHQLESVWKPRVIEFIKKDDSLHYGSWPRCLVDQDTTDYVKGVFKSRGYFCAQYTFKLSNKTIRKENFSKDYLYKWNEEIQSFEFYKQLNDKTHHHDRRNQHLKGIL